MNVSKEDLGKVMGLLPSLKAPTVSGLYSEGWCAVETVVIGSVVRDLIPSLQEAGAEGIWSPFMIMRVGYCEQTCVLCSQVCPTGAIWPLDETDKLGKKEGAKFVSIGTAFFDKNRCLPYAFDRPCIVCQEHCPTSPKAIFLKEEKVIRRDGTEIILQRPYIDPVLCWGCGVCEFVCPVKDKAGVYVTNIGETRSPGKKFLLGEKK